MNHRPLWIPPEEQKNALTKSILLIKIDDRLGPRNVQKHIYLTVLSILTFFKKKKEKKCEYTHKHISWTK